MELKDLSPEKQEEVKSLMQLHRSEMIVIIVSYVLLLVGLSVVNLFICTKMLTDIKNGIYFIQGLTTLLIFIGMNKELFELSDSFTQQIQEIIKK